MKKKIASLYTLCAVAIILASALLAQENTISAPKTEIEHFQKLANIANSVENEISTLAQPSSIRITLNNRALLILLIAIPL